MLNLTVALNLSELNEPSLILSVHFVRFLNSQIVAFPPSGCEGDQCDKDQTPSASAVVKSQQLSQDFLAQFTQVSSPNGGDRKHRDAGAVLPFIGLTGSKCTLHTQ